MNEQNALHFEELEAKRLWSGTYEVYNQTTNTGCSIYQTTKTKGWELVNPCEAQLFWAPTIKEILIHFKEKYT